MQTVDLEGTSDALRRATVISLWTTRAAAVLLLALGVYIWTGNGDELIPVHMVIGLLLVLSLWTIATIAARSGVSRVVVGLAVAWSVLAALLGLIQEDLVTGAWHWTIQALHLVIAMAMVGWSQYLVTLLRRSEAGARLWAKGTRVT
jgi:hypothetical protein